MTRLHSIYGGRAETEPRRDTFAVNDFQRLRDARG
jgi:hypothetical protein